MENKNCNKPNLSNNKFLFIDENDFYKKYKSLKKYCPKAFKYLCFNFFKNVSKNKYEDGKYVENVPTSLEFKKLYGQIQLLYSIKNGSIIIENLNPSDFFLDGHNRDLDVYLGMPYRNERDKFKIQMIMKLKGK